MAFRSAILTAVHQDMGMAMPGPGAGADSCVWAGDRRG
jgi:hypothetical protein